MMNIHIDIADNAAELGKRAAKKIAALLNDAIREKGSARMILSTGASQFETLEALVKEDVDWTKPASFRKYLKERFVSKVRLKAAWFVENEECLDNLTKELRRDRIDVGVIGIGENGHVAFNDPPADFDTDAAYKVVTLDTRCRMQQVGEGWFGSIDEVPEKAITMCVRQILSAEHIVSSVPHSVKAEAIYNTITKPVNPAVPATILKTHPDWNLFIDRESASKLLGM